ncbi:hypothetical protein KP509_03G090900 [Ceratopteris richardii]|uniref:NAC domain-containing protein n=1 Tax=Ceratopteris richardii TaxID=49495 RepID=A0A8T2VDF4_CERRI|nr:hypothetical protein KP509_03G090900 [Ceratopteris richardii]
MRQKLMWRTRLKYKLSRQWLMTRMSRISEYDMRKKLMWRIRLKYRRRFYQQPMVATSSLFWDGSREGDEDGAAKALAQIDESRHSILASADFSSPIESSASPAIFHGDKPPNFVRLLPSLPPGFRFQPTDEELIGYYLTRKVKGMPIPASLIPDVDLYTYDPWDLTSLSPNAEYLHSSTHSSTNAEHLHSSTHSSTIPQWYFFTSCDPKYSHGFRANRSTRSGYWKATGRDRPVLRTYLPSTSVVSTPSLHTDALKLRWPAPSPDLITPCVAAPIDREAATQYGFKKTLVFYRGKPPRDTRMPWVMHEFYLCSSPSSSSASSSVAQRSLCNKIVLCRIVLKTSQAACRAEHQD